MQKQPHRARPVIAGPAPGRAGADAATAGNFFYTHLT
jgi:hypothetical protein